MHIVDDVSQRTPEDYQAVTQAEVERLRALPEVVAVYSTGMVKAPGISDLDLIAVVDLDRSSRRVRPQLKRALKLPTEDYIRTHPIFTISPELFPQLRWLADLSTLDCLAGTDIGAEPIPPAYQNLLRSITTLETGIHKFFALCMFVQEKSIGARNLLLSLNSIGYSLSLAEQLSQCSNPQRDSIQKFRADLLQLRSNWFVMEPAQRVSALVPLIELAPRLLLQALEVASRHLVEACRLTGKQAEGAGHLSIDPHGLVTLDLQRGQCDPQLDGQAFGDWCRDFGKHAANGLPAPIGLAIPFAFYHASLQSDPKRQQYLDARAYLDQNLRDWCLTTSGPLREGLQQRAKIMCQYAQWYRPFWTCSVSFSIFTPWLMGRRSFMNKLWARVEQRGLRFFSEF